MGIKRLDDFNHDVEVTKEVLASMPINNAKNVTIYKKKVKELKDEYSSYRDQLFTEIKVRSSKYLSIKPNPRTSVVSKELTGYKDLVLCNPVNTAYEKMGFDTLLYSLTHYYKNDLSSVNADIKEVISKFNLVGINITDKDFVYSSYAQKYIKELLKDDYIERMKDIFEDIHWKCPDVILHIEVSFRILFNKNIKLFESYIDEVKKEVLGSDLTYEDYRIKRDNLSRELFDLENFDHYVIVNRFMNGELLLNDYSKLNVEKSYSRFLGDKLEDKESKLDDFKNLYFNLDEYKNYLKYSYILEDAKVKYAECSSHVGEAAKILKEINSLSDELSKLCSDIESGSTKGFLFFKKKIDTEQYLLKLNEKVKELDSKFEEYDNALVFEKMSANISETSSVYDVFNFALSFKGYLRSCIKNHEDGVDIKKVKATVKEYDLFLNSPYLNMLKNIKFSIDSDITTVLVDHFKLLNINLNPDELDADSIESLMKSIYIILVNSYLETSGMTIDTILDLFESKKIIEMYDKAN